MTSAESTSYLRNNAPLLYVSEETVRALVRQAEVTEAIAKAFEAHARGSAFNYPVLREALGHQDAIFGFKSGFDRGTGVLGIKAGGLWPGNKIRDLPNHQSTTLLFDPDTGAPCALIGTTYLTALRTAAASALSIRTLARSEAEVLGVVGAGGQGRAQVMAAMAERPIKQVLVNDQSAESAAALVRSLRDQGVDAAEAAVPELCGASDVVITVTPSRTPLLDDADIRPGTHLACMGADTAGKQEVPTALIVRAKLFGDEPSQAIAIGECQHAYRDGLIGPDSIIPLGAVLAGDAPGRSDDAEVTLFDSTGMALQDLAAAQVALRAASAAGRTMELPA